MLAAFLRGIGRGELGGADVRFQPGMDHGAFVLAARQRAQAQQGRNAAGLDDPLAAAGADQGAGGELGDGCVHRDAVRGRATGPGAGTAAAMRRCRRGNG